MCSVILLVVQRWKAEAMQYLYLINHFRSGIVFHIIIQERLWYIIFHIYVYNNFLYGKPFLRKSILFLACCRAELATNLHETKLIYFYNRTAYSNSNPSHGFWDRLIITSNSVALVHEGTIPSERPPFVGEVSANFCEKWVCRVVSAAEPYSRNLGFLDRSRYFCFQVARQLYSRSWVDPVPDRILLRKSDSAGNRNPTSGSVSRNSDH
jgi:hypothetical protein